MRPEDLAGFAVTALLRHRVRTALSLVGVAIGVAAVVLLTGLGEGARGFVLDEFASLGSNLLVLIPGKNETTGAYPGVGGVPHDLTLADARALQRALPQIRALAPLSMGNETVSHHDRHRQVMVLGSTPEFLEVRQLRVAYGSFLPPGDIERGSQVAVLGATVARELFGNEPAVGHVVRIGDWRTRVIGVLERKGTQIGLNLDDLVLVPVATGMRLFDRRSLFRILIKLRAHEEIASTCPRALEILRERHGEEDVTCVTQESVISSLSSILRVLTLGLVGIAAISLSVAGIGIMNLMLVSVSERTHEIGLLKAVGASRRQVLAVFLAEAVFLASAGGLLGLAVGGLGTQLIAWLYPNFPVTVPAWALWAALATSFVVGALFGVLPARRATQLDPVDALSGR
ncbi:MAG: ABC transporter permease [Myxococcota bacterium]